MKQLIQILPLLTVIIYSCSNTHSEISKTLTTKSGTGGMCSMPYVVNGNDTLPDGKFICYSASGKVVEEGDYKNGSKEGWDKFYDSLGTIDHRIFYKQGQKNGEGIFYDVKGEIKKKHFIDDRVVSEERTNSKLVPIQYQVFRANGDVQYIVLFDSVGHKFYENGFVFDDTVQFVNSRKDSVLANRSVQVRIFTTQLPDYSRIVRSSIFERANNKLNVLENVKTDDFCTIIEFIPRSVGKQTLTIIGQLIDKAGKIVKTDTLVQQLMVYE